MTKIEIFAEDYAVGRGNAGQPPSFPADQLDALSSQVFRDGTAAL